VISALPMTREEAIAIYRAGEEATVTALLAFSSGMEELTKRIEWLEEALDRKSTNSLKPPSSDGITKPPGKRRAQDGETKRKPGGQKGHRGVSRKLFPEDEVSTIKMLCPKKCKKCGNRNREDINNSRFLPSR
jgi:transposase